MIVNYRTSSGISVSMITIADLWTYAECEHGADGLWLGMDGLDIVVRVHGVRVDRLKRID